MKFELINQSEHGQLLYEMDVKAFTRDFDFPSRSVDETIKYLSGCDVYLAYKDKELVGLFAIKIDKEVIEVKQIIVLPKHQKKGYGEEIVKKLLQVTKGKKVKLVVHPKNIIALILYLKNGFEIIEWKDNFYGDGEPRLILSRL